MTVIHIESRSLGVSKNSSHLACSLRAHSMVWPTSPGAMACSWRVSCSLTLRRAWSVIDSPRDWIGTTVGLLKVVPTVRLRVIPRSRHAATLLYQTVRATTCQPSRFGARPCYARVRGGAVGGDLSMACKGSGVQIPSAPPQVSDPLRGRLPANPGARAATSQQPRTRRGLRWRRKRSERDR